MGRKNIFKKDGKWGLTNGAPHAIIGPSGGDPVPDSKSKTAWEAQNVVQVKVKVNRNQDPELYDLLSKAPSKSGLARDLMNQAIKQTKNKGDTQVKK